MLEVLRAAVPRSISQLIIQVPEELVPIQIGLAASEAEEAAETAPEAKRQARRQTCAPSWTMRLPAR